MVWPQYLLIDRQRLLIVVLGLLVLTLCLKHKSQVVKANSCIGMIGTKMALADCKRLLKVGLSFGVLALGLEHPDSTISAGCGVEMVHSQHGCINSEVIMRKW
jgi:hypothetical protein